MEVNILPYVYPDGDLGGDTHVVGEIKQLSKEQPDLLSDKLRGQGLLGQEGTMSLVLFARFLFCCSCFVARFRVTYFLVSSFAARFRVTYIHLVTFQPPFN